MGRTNKVHNLSTYVRPFSFSLVVQKTGLGKTQDQGPCVEGTRRPPNRRSCDQAKKAAKKAAASDKRRDLIDEPRS